MNIGVDTESEDGHLWCMGVADDVARAASKDYYTLVNQIHQEGRTPVFHNAKWDLAEFRKAGIIWDDWEDTILEAHLLGHHPLGLKALTPIFTGVQLSEYADVVGTGKNAVPMDSIVNTVLAYCSIDAWATYTLNTLFTVPPHLQAIYDKEKQITRVIMAMEARGLPLSQSKLRLGRQQVLKRLAELERDLLACGIEELTKKDAIAQRFWKGKPKKVTTPSGALSTQAEVMRTYATATDKWVEPFIEWRQLSHFMVTYLDAWRSQDWLHPSINQTGTMTGRFSCSEPNLQNVPKSALVSLYGLFVAPEGHTFISVDYSQLELRVLANLTKDSGMLAAYSAGRDLHQETQDKLESAGLFAQYGITHPDEKRRFSKTVNFGVTYGITDYGLAPRLKLPQGGAQPFIDGFYESYPAVAPWQRRQVSFAEERGYVETDAGHPLYVPCILAERGRLRSHGEKQCANYPIQGTAAEIVKDGMLSAPQYLCLQIHDELLYLVPTNEATSYAHFLEEVLVDKRHQVEYTLNIKSGQTWGDIKSLSDLWVDEDE